MVFPRHFVFLICLALAACGVAPTHPVLRQASLPPLLPVRDFVADIDYSGGYRISPDGQSLLWLEMHGSRIGLAVRRVDDVTLPASVLRFGTGQIAPWSSVGIAYNWLSDSRHVVYVRDPHGDENTQIHVFDATDARGQLHDLTPWPNSRSLYVAHATPGSARFYFQSNRRDASAFDLYEADAEQLTTREVMQSDGRVVNWLIDNDGTLGGRIRLEEAQAGSSRLLEIIDPTTAQWRTVRRFDAYGYLSPLRLDRAAGILVANSGMGRNTTALVAIDLATGQERELFRDPRVDLTASYVQLGATKAYAVQIDPGYPEVVYLDPELDKQVHELVRAQLPEALITIGAGTADRRLERMVVRPLTVHGEREYLLDRRQRQLILLKDVRADPPLLQIMSPVEPVSYTARDGALIASITLKLLRQLDICHGERRILVPATGDVYTK